jgi:hypothetical protein
MLSDATHLVVQQAPLGETAAAAVVGTYDLVSTAAYGGGQAAAMRSAAGASTIAASKLAIQQQPTTGTAGQALKPAVKVAVEDSSGNVVAGNQSTVTLTLSSGKFASGSSTASVRAVKGIATFDNLVLDTVGNYTLSVSDGSLTAATSASVTIGAAAAAKLVFQQAPTNGTAGVALNPAVVVAVQDKFGNVISGDSSTVALTLNSGNFAGGSNTATVPAVNGVAAFSGLVLNTARSYTLSASDGSLAKATAHVTVNPAVASKLVFQPQHPPLTLTAGQTFNAIVMVEDQFGNIVVGDNSPVVLTLDTGIAIPYSNTATVQAVKGVATFGSLTLTKAGTSTLIASDGSLPEATANITVNPAAASKLVFQQQPPLTSMAGQPFSATVAVEDRFGNVVTGNNSTISLASNPSGLKGTTRVSAVNGLATFSDLNLTKVGTHTLIAGDGSLAKATSSAITINPAVAAQLVFQQAPTKGTAGAALNPPVVVAVQDKFGNVVTGDSSAVTLTLNGGKFADGSQTATAPVVEGVATFDHLVLNAAGSYTLSASDGSLTAATSAKITVGAAAAAQLILEQSPTNGTAGVALKPAVTIAVEDKFGNVVAGDSSTVTLTLTSGKFASGSNMAKVHAAKGIATFANLVLDTAGSYTLSASDGSLTGATPVNVTIAAAAASKLVFLTIPSANTAPPTNTAGTPLSPAVTVAVEDRYGNVVSGDSSTISVSVSSGPGGFAVGSQTQAAAVKGVATFDQLVLDTAGSYTLSASDGSLKGKSGSLQITPAQAAQLVFVKVPSSGNVGHSLTPPVKVAVEDAFGNMVTSDSSVVSVAASGVATLDPSSTTSVAAVKGVTTFSNLVFATPGTCTLSASDGSLTCSSPPSLSISAANQLAFQSLSSTAIAGHPITVTVLVEDKFGAVVSTDNSRVTLTLTSGTFANGSTTATLQAINGVATCSVIFGRATAYTLIASDGVLFPATSSPITIQAGQASKLVFAQAPSTASTGATLGTVQVDVEDQYGNLATTDTSVVSLTLIDPPGALYPFGLSGTVAVPAKGGVATFTNLDLYGAGLAGYQLTVNLKASDGALQSATSLNILATYA